MTEIQKRLFELKDEKYKDFQCRLMPDIAPEKVIGVRTPLLRGFARELFSLGNFNEFLDSLPHTYYDENNLHSFIVCEIKDYDECVRRVDELLPYVDNWATCDSMSPKVFKKNPDRLLLDICRWLKSDRTYTVRFAEEMLMDHFLDSRFSPQYLEWVAAVRSDEYYVNMMTAWFFSTALAKQYDAAVPYIEEHRLDTWTHNKTIQKACESLRLTKEQKTFLKSLRSNGN